MHMALRTSMVVGPAIVARPRRFELVALFVASVAVLVAAAPSEAAADDPLALPASPKALQHFDKGSASFEAGAYDQAVAEYEAGAKLEDLPLWDWGLGLAHQRAGTLERARWYYERFISRIRNMVDVDDYIAAARLHINEIDAAQTKPEAEDKDERRPDSRIASSPPSPSPFTTTRKIAIGVGVGSLVAGGVGVALTLRAQGLKDDAAALCPTSSCSRAEEANQLASDANTSNDRALIAYGVGAVALGAAVVLWLVGAPEHTSTVAVPHLSPTYAGIDVSMRF